VSRRTFSIAIAAWSAKVWRRATVGERPFDPRHHDGADRLALPEHGHHQQGLISLGDREVPRARGHRLVVLHPLKVYGASLPYRSRRDVVA
jgi:hypothetical protein